MARPTTQHFTIVLSKLTLRERLGADLIRSFRYVYFNTSTSKTEYIKAEFEANCNDVIDIHPYVDQSKKEADEGDEEIESLPQPQPYS